MKSKKNRKSFHEPFQVCKQLTKQSNEIFKIKFDVLKNDISCFITKNRNSKFARASKNKRSSSRQQSVKKNQLTNIETVEKVVQEKKLRSQSPDLIRDSSNTILSQIEEKGVRFDWDDAENKTQQKFDFEEQQQNEKLRHAFDSSFQKSHASTNDYICYQSTSYYWQNSQQMTQIIPQNQFTIQPEYICRDWRTTLMIRNIPNKYSVSELAQQIDSQHADTYDFLYLPCDLKNQCNVGYGFINFINTQHLHSFYLKFQQYIWKRYRSEKICSLTYARLQGLIQLIQHFENSKVLCQKQKKYRPIIKYDEIQKMVLRQQNKENL